MGLQQAMLKPRTPPAATHTHTQFWVQFTSSQLLNCRIWVKTARTISVPHSQHLRAVPC